MQSTTRQYRGMSAEQRTTERRAQFMEAILELVGTVGMEKATMSAMCTQARLTERYFYENFKSRDDAIIQAIDQVANEIREAAERALHLTPGDAYNRSRAAIQAFVEILIADPRKGRLGIIEASGSQTARKRQRELLHSFASMVAEESALLYKKPSESDQLDKITALLFVGGLAELITAWLNKELQVSPEQIIEAATHQFTSTYKNRPSPPS
ncbi:MAG: TetR/AcrR family transcriptional regulator [Mycobacteriaceae bacterium]